MARKSRVNIQPPEKHIYKVGAYLRLSRDKNDGKNEDSLENQKNIILSYISDKDDFKLQSTYCDNDKTGTNFNREGFENLMNDIKSKKINCIIVKDLSRFGRDYKDCCNYIENIFPFLGVRFIAINDNFDTNNLTSNDILNMQLKNIVNEMYATDLSKKIKSSLRAKKEEGKYLGAFPPYGYLKDPNDKYKLIVDEEVRPVIEMIFNLRAEGKGYFAIVKELVNLNIDSPGQHFYKMGIVCSDKFKNSKWHYQKISDILRNKVYLGYSIQAKTTSIKKNTYKKIKVSEDKWIVKENIYEPIISQEIFNKVEEINKLNEMLYIKNHKYDSNNLFKGILICSNCGKKLYLRTRKYKKRNNTESTYLTYFCRNCLKNIASENNYINLKTLKQVVMKSLVMQVQVCQNATNLLKTTTFKHKVGMEINQMKTSLQALQVKLDKTTKSYNGLYEDYLNEFISKDEYISLKNKYKEEQNYINGQIKKITNNLKSFEQKTENNKFIKNVLKFNNIDELNRDIIINLIEKIIVHSPNKIEITFKFEDDFDIFKNDLNEGYLYE